MITVGPMSLHQPETLDPMEPYFTGTQADGGLHTDMARLSSHDHSGGLLGAPVAVTIPDGSITAADLDPSVLAPYALVDGSKPFTGQVTMQADAVVRDALFFGEQGTALAPDVSLTRTAPDTLRFGADVVLARTGAGALRADTHLGVGVSPGAWSGANAIQVGADGALWGSTSSSLLALAQNSHYDGTAERAFTSNPAAKLFLNGGALTLQTAPGVAAGAAQTFTTRLNLALTGTLSLTPDGGQPALVTAGALSGGTGFLQLGGTTAVSPTGDNTHALGWSSLRWTVVYAAAGSINTSVAAAKEGITPLDPAACAAAVLETDWVSFRYLPPPYQEPPEQADASGGAAEEPEARQRQVDESRAAHARMLVETAPTRHQKGYVLQSQEHKTHELFGLEDRQSASPGSDLAVVACGLQHALARIAALEAGGAA